MWKNEFKRLLKSYKTVIVIVVLVLLGGISFYFTMQTKMDFIKMKQSMPADINPTNLLEVLNYFKGLKFNIEFYLTSDFIQFYLIVLLIFVGIFLSSELHKRIVTGQENFILSRVRYKKEIFNLFVAQSLYIATIVLISSVLIIFIGYLVGGFGGDSVPFGMYKLTNSSGLFLIAIQILIILIYVILANAIALFSNVFIKDKIMIQIFPFFLFYIVPTIIVSYLCQLFSINHYLIKYFIPSTMLLGIDTIVQSESYFVLIKYYLLPFLVYLLLLIIIYVINKLKLGKDTL